MARRIGTRLNCRDSSRNISRFLNNYLPNSSLIVLHVATESTQVAEKNACIDWDTNATFKMGKGDVYVAPLPLINNQQSSPELIADLIF